MFLGFSRAPNLPPLLLIYLHNKNLIKKMLCVFRRCKKERERERETEAAVGEKQFAHKQFPSQHSDHDNIFRLKTLLGVVATFLRRKELF